MMKITKDDIDRFDEIRLIVLSVILGASFSEYQPSTVLSMAFKGAPFVLIVTVFFWGVHNFSAARKADWRYHTGMAFTVIFFAVAFLVTCFDPRYESISASLSLSKQGANLLFLTSYVWVVTSFLVALARHFWGQRDDQVTKI